LEGFTGEAGDFFLGEEVFEGLLEKRLRNLVMRPIMIFLYIEKIF
jgi:hypothetical protein